MVKIRMLREPQQDESGQVLAESHQRRWGGFATDAISGCRIPRSRRLPRLLHDLAKTLKQFVLFVDFVVKKEGLKMQIKMLRLGVQHYATSYVYC